MVPFFLFLEFFFIDSVFFVDLCGEVFDDVVCFGVLFVDPADFRALVVAFFHFM